MRLNLSEAAPPDKSIETWIKKNKKRFTDRYGEDEGVSILYGRAWDMYNSRKEKSESLSEETIRVKFANPSKAKLFVNTAKDLGLVKKDSVSGNTATIVSQSGSGDIVKSLADDADGILVENWNSVFEAIRHYFCSQNPYPIQTNAD